jgi:ABC-type tungstate transport system permease subunit
MWTPTTRRRYSRNDLRYETDLTDAEWAVIEPLLPEPPGQGRPHGLEKPTGGWYHEVGQGMGPTLSLAVGLNGYTLTDRATWASFKNRGSLEILTERDAALINPYGSILVHPAKGAHIKASDARTWHEWLISEEGRKAIASFKIEGEQIFFPASTAPRS